MYVTNRLSKYGKVWKRAAGNSHVWFQVDKRANLFNVDVYIAVCYTPPITGRSVMSDLMSQHVYSDLAADIGLLKQKGAEVLLTGDFNAHTSNEQEYVHLCETSHVLQVPDVGLDDLPPTGTIMPRRNKDPKRPSSTCWGPELLEMCAAEDLLIINGRLQGDSYGQCTFHRNASTSTVDYFNASSAVFAQSVPMYV